MKNVILLIFFYFTNLIVTAQHSSASVHSITLPNGKEIGSINCIFQDKIGYIWIGSENGLYRYDAENVISAGEFTLNELTNCVVFDILEDEHQNLWVSTQEGLIQISKDRKKSEKIYPTQWKDEKLNQKPWSHSLYLSKNNDLYFGTQFGLVKYNLQSNAKKLFPIFDKTTIKDNRKGTTFIVYDNQDHLLLGSNYGICKFSISNETWEYIYLESEEDIEDWSENSVSDLEIINDTTYVISTWASGIKIYNPKNTKIKTYLFNETELISGSKNIVEDVMQDKDSSHFIHLATVDKGKIIFNLKTNTFSHNPANVSQKGYLTLFSDKEKNLWMGSSTGLEMLASNDGKFSFKNISTEGKIIDHIICLEEDIMHQKVYIATYTDGIWIWHKRNNTFTKLDLIDITETGAIYTLFLDLDKLYIFTQNKNLIYDVTTKKLSILEEEKTQNFIQATNYSKNELLLFSFNKFPILYHKISKEKQPLKPDNKNDQLKFQGISCVAEFNLDEFYFGTFRDGIGIFNKETKIITWLFSMYKDVPIHDIYEIKVIQNRFLWFSTGRMGLFLYDLKTKKLTNYRQFDGLQINTIFDFLVDKDGDFWLSSNRGLIYFDPETMQSQLFDQLDGLENNSVIDEIQILADNRIFVPGWTGFSLGDIAELKKQGKAAKLVLNHFKINGESIELAEDNFLNLKYNENNFNIDFALLSYNQSFLNKYRYKLVGLQDEWIISNANEISLIEIPPGEYELIIEAYDHDNTLSANQIRIKITIAIPYWKTIWFNSLLIFGLMGILFLIFRYRIKQIKKVQTLRNKIASDLHDEVGSALSSIKLYSSFALHQNNEKKTQDLFEKIHDTTKESIENMSDIVWSINPKNDSTEKLISKMKSFSDTILQSSGMEIEYQFAITHLNISMIHRRHLYLFYKEVINNIAKYSKATKVDIKLYLKNKEIQLIIFDNGIGFDKEKINEGNGLSNLKLRAGELNGRVEIDPSPNQGTKIVLTFKPT